MGKRGVCEGRGCGEQGVWAKGPRRAGGAAALRGAQKGSQGRGGGGRFGRAGLAAPEPGIPARPRFPPPSRCHRQRPRPSLSEGRRCGSRAEWCRGPSPPGGREAALRKVAAPLTGGEGASFAGSTGVGCAIAPC